MHFDRLPVSIDSENLCRDSGGRGGNGGPASLSEGISSSLSMSVSIRSFDGRRAAIRFVVERLHRTALGTFSAGLWSLRRMCWQLWPLLNEERMSWEWSSSYKLLAYTYVSFRRWLWCWFWWWCSWPVHRLRHGNFIVCGRFGSFGTFSEPSESLWSSGWLV